MELAEKVNIEKYMAYKDSGVEWIEAVPSHWEVKKFKRVFYEIKKRTNPALNCGSISFGKVVYKDDEKIPDSTKRSYQVVQKGDFLVNPLNLNYDLISLRIALSDIDVVVSSGYIVLSNTVKLDKTFYKYFLHRFDVAFMKLLGSGVRQTLNWNDIANCDLIFPPLPEQTAIAAFLDRKTAIIDQAIDIKQKQIELLKERRQILIHKAVTRGLNPNVQLKDSGVEWIGVIPVHWEVRRSKFLFEQRKERARKGDVQLSATQAYGVIPQEEYESKIERRVVKIQFHLEKRKHVEVNDFVISMRSFQGGLERAWSTGCIRSSYVILKPIETIDATFYSYLLKSADYIKALQSTASFIRDGQDLNYENFAMVDLFIPPLTEQKEISEYIDANLKLIDKAIELQTAQIEKIKEYKSTLINSMVTGKIKVC
jgi:type I restriction enzyme S subunit